MSSIICNSIQVLLVISLLAFYCNASENNNIHLSGAPKPAAISVPAGMTAQDLIRVHESVRPVNWLGAKQSELAPESQVVGVYFDSVSLNIAQDELAKAKANKTKQSQEFETHLESGSSPTTPVVVVSTESTTTTQAAASTTPAENSTLTPEGWPNQPATVTSTSTTTTTPIEPLLPVDPVGSRTARAGSAVACGEANPNGKSNKNLDRIVGGHKSEPGEFPFQVRLNIRSRRGSGICGGVILDDWHILTAAHCMTACVSQHLSTATIENTGVKATIGDHSIRSNDGEVEVDIERITPHEKYDACNFYANDHDIALIKTSSPIEYRFTTDGYGSINRPCMPKSAQVDYREGDKVIVSGWGVTRENSGSLSNILRYVQVPIVNTTRCQETYGARVTNDHVCAGFQSGGKDSCQGDSGGPLVRVVDNRYELVGIVSFGYGCGQPSAPGVYTRVASYIDWVQANL